MRKLLAILVGLLSFPWRTALVASSLLSVGAVLCFQHLETRYLQHALTSCRASLITLQKSNSVLALSIADQNRALQRLQSVGEQKQRMAAKAVRAARMQARVESAKFAAMLAVAPLADECGTMRAMLERFISIVGSDANAR